MKNPSTSKVNKNAQYIKYALGEIILVVIGILIALQINNWNQDRLERKDEVKILKQLNIDLKANLLEIKDLENFVSSSAKAGKNLIGALDKGYDSIDSLKQWAEQFQSSNIFNNANTTYKNLESNQKNIISNDSLRLRITLMYEKDFFNIHTRERFLYDQYMPYYLSEFYKNFKVSNSTDTFYGDDALLVNTPIDFEDLQKNELYKNTLVDLYNFRLLRLKWLRQTILQLEELIVDIDTEIESKK